ncbi:MAG: hypothetical protein HY727_03540 [Candidatus Rokubacteria bacterium]|nr:hypothetical protein [Candidatus Rokubacteria bacterium]
MTFGRAIWEARKAASIWKWLVLGFDLIGVSGLSIGQIFDIFTAHRGSFYVLMACTATLFMCGVWLVAERAWTKVDAERRELLRRFEPRLDLIFDRDCPGCVYKPTINDQSVRWLRVGVLNMGGASIGDVRVFLAELRAVDRGNYTPRHIALPTMLRPMHDESDSGLPLILNPSPTHLHIDFIARSRNSINFQFNFAPRGIKRRVPVRWYSGKLVVDGHDVPASERYFLIGPDTFGFMTLDLTPDSAKIEQLIASRPTDGTNVPVEDDVEFIGSV